MYRKQIIYLSLLIANLFSNVIFANNLPDLNPNSLIPSPQLGGGYSTDLSQAVTNMCINAGPVTQSGQNTGLIDLATKYSLDDVKNQLNFTANGHVNIGLFSASASYDFMHYLQSDSLSESLIYRTTTQFMDTNYSLPAKGTPVLNDVGLMHWKNGPDDFRTYCGDSYVAQMHNGGHLYVALQFNFKTTVDKQKFAAAFSGSYSDFATFNANFQQQIDKLNVQGEIHVLGLQMGGMPQYITAIFQNPDPTQPSASTQCSLSDIAACHALMNAVVDYLKPGDGHSPQIHYPDQFGDDPTHAPINTAETGIEPNDYYAIVPEIHTDSKLTPTMITMRDNLGNQFMTQNSLLQRADYVMKIINIPYAYDAYRVNLVRLVNNLQANTINLQRAGFTCFSDLPNCISNGQATLNTLLPVDPSVLKLPDTFFVSTKDAQGIQHQQTFVAVDESQPYDEVFQGAETSPNSQTFDLAVVFDQDTGDVSIQQLDHTTGQLFANFDGTFQGGNLYRGTIQYADGSTGTWSGTFVKSALSKLTLLSEQLGKGK